MFRSSRDRIPVEKLRAMADLVSEMDLSEGAPLWLLLRAYEAAGIGSFAEARAAVEVLVFAGILRKEDRGEAPYIWPGPEFEALFISSTQQETA